MVDLLKIQPNTFCYIPYKYLGQPMNFSVNPCKSTVIGTYFYSNLFCKKLTQINESHKKAILMCVKKRF